MRNAIIAALLVVLFASPALAVCTTPKDGAHVADLTVSLPHYAVWIPGGETYHKGQMGAETPLANAQMFLDFVAELKKKPEVWVVREMSLHRFYLQFGENEGCRIVIVGFTRP